MSLYINGKDVIEIRLESVMKTLQEFEKRLVQLESQQKKVELNLLQILPSAFGNSNEHHQGEN